MRVSGGVIKNSAGMGRTNPPGSNYRIRKRKESPMQPDYRLSRLWYKIERPRRARVLLLAAIIALAIGLRLYVSVGVEPIGYHVLQATNLELAANIATGKGYVSYL